MARKHTGPENVVVNEGRTGRIIARRILRRVLGNPKKRQRDTEALAQEMFSKGVNVGADLMQGRIVNAAAHLTYGEEVNAEIVDGSSVEVSRVSSDSVSDVPGDADSVELAYEPSTSFDNEADYLPGAYLDPLGH